MICPVAHVYTVCTCTISRMKQPYLYPSMYSTYLLSNDTFQLEESPILHREYFVLLYNEPVLVPRNGTSLGMLASLLINEMHDTG